MKYFKMAIRILLLPVIIPLLLATILLRIAVVFFMGKSIVKAMEDGAEIVNTER